MGRQQLTTVAQPFNLLMEITHANQILKTLRGYEGVVALSLSTNGSHLSALTNYFLYHQRYVTSSMPLPRKMSARDDSMELCPANNWSLIQEQPNTHSMIYQYLQESQTNLRILPALLQMVRRLMYTHLEMLPSRSVISKVSFANYISENACIFQLCESTCYPSSDSGGIIGSAPHLIVVARSRHGISMVSWAFAN